MVIGLCATSYCRIHCGHVYSGHLAENIHHDVKKLHHQIDQCRSVEKAFWVKYVLLQVHFISSVRYAIDM
jgi:hypothetical protein